MRVRTAPHACARLDVGSLSHDVGADTSALSLCPMPSAEPQCKMVAVQWALLCCCLACTQRERDSDTHIHTETEAAHTHTHKHMETLVNEFAYFSSLCLLHILFITFWRFFAASSSSGGNGSGSSKSSGGSSSDGGGDNDAAPPTVAAAPHESVIRHSQKHFHTHTHSSLFPSPCPSPPLLFCYLSLCSQNPTPFLVSLTRLSPIAAMLFWVCFRLLCLFVFLVFIINDTIAFPFLLLSLLYLFPSLSISPFFSLFVFFFPFYVTCWKFDKFLNYIYPCKFLKSSECCDKSS